VQAFGRPKLLPIKDWPADKVERRKVDELVPYANNARTHSDKQVEQLAGAAGGVRLCKQLRNHPDSSRSPQTILKIDQSKEWPQLIWLNAPHEPSWQELTRRTRPG
jgi:hypothetical protein